MNKEHSLNSKGYIFLLAAAVLFSFRAIIGKYAALQGVDPVAFAHIQAYTVPALLILFSLLRKNRGVWKEGLNRFKDIGVLGAIGTFGTSFFVFASLNYLNAGIVSLLLFTSPIFANLYFIISRKRRISVFNIVSLVVAMIGCCLVLNIFGGESQLSVLGIFFGLCAGMSYAFFNVYYDLKLEGINKISVLLFSYIVAAATYSLVDFNFIISPPAIGLPIIALAVISSIFTMIIPVLLLYKAIQYVGSDKITIAGTVEVPITLLSAYFILGETLLMTQFIGTILVLIAVVILESERNFKKYYKCE
ncbi:MAG: DMT family transporter [Anaerovoracaceae bacterium]